MAAITLAVILHAVVVHAVAIPTSFALVPCAVNSNVIIDYAKEDSRKTFNLNNMTKKLKHNHTGVDLKQLLEEIEKQSNEASLGKLAKVSSNINVVNKPTIHDLPANFGQFTLNQVHGHAAIFDTTLKREAHVAMQLTLCILKFFTSIDLESKMYKINKTKVGFLVIKVSQVKACTDTQFKINAIRLKLRRLDAKDFDKVNPYECSLISSLASHFTELEHSFYTNLITGYLACTNKTSVDHISRKQEVQDEHPGTQNVRAAAEILISYVTNKDQQLLFHWACIKIIAVMKRLCLQWACMTMGTVILGFKMFFCPENSEPIYRKESKLNKFIRSTAASVSTKVLQPLTFCFEDQVRRWHTSSCHKHRNAGLYRSQKIPGIKSISRRLFHGGLCLHILSNQQKVLASRSLCLFTVHSEMEGRAKTNNGPLSFDTNSYEIGIGDATSYSMSHRDKDFEGHITLTNRRGRGIAGLQLTRVGYGITVWKIEKDTGRSHNIRLPNSLHVPERGVRLLSRQHWAQHARDNRPNPRETCCVTYGDYIAYQRQFKRTFAFPLFTNGSNIATIRNSSNVAIIRSSTGYESFAAFKAKLDPDVLYCTSAASASIDPNGIFCVPAAVSIPSGVSDDEEAHYNGSNVAIRDNSEERPPTDSQLDTDSHGSDVATRDNSEERPPTDSQLDTDSHGSDVATRDNSEERPPTDSQLDTDSHLHAGAEEFFSLDGPDCTHVIVHCHVPICTSCLNGKATRQPGRSKIGDTQSKHNATTRSNQLVSPTPTLIAQLHGSPSTKPYRCATVLVDHFSGHGYFHVQKSIKVLDCTPSLTTKDGKSPLPIFSDTNVKVNAKRWVPLACQTYMPENKRQAGKKISKWLHRSRIGQYLGFTSQHSRTVSLVLSLSTGVVSPQFHVIFDANFETLRRSSEATQPDKCHFQNSKNPVPPFLRSNIEAEGAPPANEDLAEDEGATDPERAAEVPEGEFRDSHDDADQPELLHPTTPQAVPDSHPTSQYVRPLQTTQRLIEIMDSKTEKLHYPFSLATTTLKELLLPTRIIRRMRGLLNQREPQKCLRGNSMTITMMQINRNFCLRLLLKWCQTALLHSRHSTVLTPPQTVPDTFVALEVFYNANDILDLCNSDNVVSFRAYRAVSDPDTLYLHEAMKQPGKAKFLKAIVEQFEGQSSNGNWENIPRMKVSQGITVQKRKRRISTQQVNKLRARLNPDGSMQAHVVHFSNTYAPIALWPIIRLTLKIQRRLDDDRLQLSQPHLINSISSDLRLSSEGVATKGMPATASQRLHRGTHSPAFDSRFNYISDIDKMLYLTTTRKDTAFVVNQCTRFCADPKVEHGKAVTWIGRYLAASRDKGTIYSPRDEGLQVYVDSDFVGSWDKGDAEWNRNTASSRAEYIITYTGCPVYWQSKQITEIALSTTKSEYVAASEDIRSVIQVFPLLEELCARDSTVFSTTPQLHCKLFEDNSGALEMLRVPRFRPRTKHMNIRYHSFRSWTDGPSARIQVQRISSEVNLSDGLTKPVPQPVLERHRKSTMGW